MEEFSAGDKIYKKIYIFNELNTDFTKCYLIKNIKKLKTPFGVSYLANIVNVDNIKDARQKDKDARRHYKSYLVKRCLLSWRVEARQRGRNMRKLRKIMFTWLAWAMVYCC